VSLLIGNSLLLIAIFLSSCENDPNKIKELTEKVIMVEEARNVESYLSQDGHIKARLRAPLMLRVSADTFYTEFPNSLHCDFFNDSNKVETWLDSKYGKYFDNLNKVYLRDSVIVINVNGDTLKSPDLWWDQNTKLFYTDKMAYYFTKDKQITSGKGLEATQDFSRITFKNLLYSTVKVPENGFPK
jgi:LPS export ABC transporter protein LptC